MCAHEGSSSRSWLPHQEAAQPVGRALEALGPQAGEVCSRDCSNQGSRLAAATGPPASVGPTRICSHPSARPPHAPSSPPLQVVHVLNNPPAGWTGGSGFITRDLIAQHLPAPGPDVMVLRCGPGPMNDAMKGHLDALGYEEASQFMF